MYQCNCGELFDCREERTAHTASCPIMADKTPIAGKEHLTVDDCLKLYEEEGILGLVDKVKAITLKVGIEKGRQMERGRINQWSFSKEAEKEIHKVVDVPVGQGDKHHMDEHSVSYITLSVLGCIRDALKKGKDD